jgi:hypothetical protein
MEAYQQEECGVLPAGRGDTAASLPAVFLLYASLKPSGSTPCGTKYLTQSNLHIIYTAPSLTEKLALSVGVSEPHQKSGSSTVRERINSPVKLVTVLYWTHGALASEDAPSLKNFKCFSL